MSRMLTAVAAITMAAGQTPVLFNQVPSRTVGQAKLQLVTASPNLIEGRELNTPIGIAVDTGVNPPILYVSDTSNNRVLVWRDARAATGSKADFVIGQNDFFTTTPLGPGTGSSTGLRNPTGIAVDQRGFVYVADSGNNRVLRYPRITELPEGLILPDLVIGQTSFSAREPNQGLAAPTARTLMFSQGGTLYTSSVAIDSTGNLWVADAGNNRVLRYSSTLLGSSPQQGPAADAVLGQPSDTTRQNIDWNNSSNRLLKSAMLFPSGLAFDPAGRLLVTDGANRLLVYFGPFQTGMAASRLAGIAVNVSGQPPRPAINEYGLYGPESVVATNEGIYVSEAVSHRIVRYDPIAQWPAETELLPSPPAKNVGGQSDLFSGLPNRGAQEPSSTTLHTPNGLAVLGGDLIVADSGNNRVLSLSLNGTNIGGGLRVLGQVDMRFRSPNLIEGREVFLFNGQTSIPGGNVFLGGAAVIDRTSNPPRLYIADTYNNRILAYADARVVKPGDTAHLVLGQGSRMEAKANAPGGFPEQPSDQGLLQPVGLAVDSRGDLFVADSGNGRILRFPRPFDQGPDVGQRANLVLGQTSFNIKITDATQRNMSRPYGLAFTAAGHLLASDYAHNRVLVFVRPDGGDFSNGQPAQIVFGQQTFQTSSGGTQENQFLAPLHIATDTDDRLYVCDSGNRRVSIFDRVLAASNNAAPAIVLTTYSADSAGRQERLGNVQGINVSPRTGEVWVADTGANRLIRYPKFDRLLLLPISEYLLPTNLPMAVSIDVADNLVVSEGTNRVSFHFPGIAAVSAAHYLRRRVSPGMIAALYPLGIELGSETVVANSVPLPTELSDIEVAIDEIPAPLYFVSPGQINFYVPMRLEPGQQVTALVRRKSTNQILASGILDVGVATPSLFTTTQNGQGQIAALNEDNTVNTNTNGIARGQVIQLFATGQGKVPNAPPDGTPASGLTSTQVLPRVVIGSGFVADSDILYSGLAPGLIGVWQINVRVPMSVPPNSATDVVVTMGSIPSNQPESGGGIIRTVIAVK